MQLTFLELLSPQKRNNGISGINLRIIKLSFVSVICVLCGLFTGCCFNEIKIVENSESTETEFQIETSTNVQNANTSNFSEQYEQLIIIGNKLLLEGFFDDSILAFSEAIVINAMNAEAYIGKANVYLAKSEENMIAYIHDNLYKGYNLTHSESIIDEYVKIAGELVNESKYDLAMELLQYGYSSTERKELIESINNTISSNSSGWENFITNDLLCMEFTGYLEWQSLSYSNFDAAIEYDIDDDREDELILRYIYSTYDYGDIEIMDMAYIILKNYNGFIVKVGEFWNSGVFEENILKFNGKNLVIVTRHGSVFATRIEVLLFTNGEFTEYFSYTELGGAENSDFITVTEENGMRYASYIAGVKERYFGNDLSTNSLLISSYEELVEKIREISSFQIIEF